MTKNTVAQLCAIAAVVTLPTLSFAGTTSKCCKTAPEKLAESAISGDLGVNVVTAYYFHGVLQAPGTSSASVQPYLDLNLKAYEGDGFLNKAVFSLGLWQSYSNPAGVTSPNNRAFYESDVTPSLALTFGKLTLTESYAFLNYPNAIPGGAQDSQLWSSKLSFDDSDLLGALALHPSVTYSLETDAKSGVGTKTGGSLWEVSVSPGTAVGPLELTLPLTLGVGSDGFYAQNGYSYFSAGLNAAYTLPVSKAYGTWKVNTGVTYYNTDKKSMAGINSDENNFVGSIGLGVAF